MNPCACHQREFGCLHTTSATTATMVFCLPPSLMRFLRVLLSAVRRSSLITWFLLTSKSKSKVSISQNLIFSLEWSARIWLTPLWPYFLLIIVLTSSLSDFGFPFFLPFFLSFFHCFEKFILYVFCIFLLAKNYFSLLSHLTIFSITLQKKCTDFILLKSALLIIPSFIKIKQHLWLFRKLFCFSHFLFVSNNKQNLFSICQRTAPLF